MTGFEIAFMLLGAFAVLSLVKWAEKSAAYSELVKRTYNEQKLQSDYIATLKQEIMYLRRMHNSDATDFIIENS